MTPEDSRWMQAALALARRGAGTTGANPNVGCILVRDGRLLGRGMTAPGGRPHAETAALEDATRRHGANAAKGATAYVTLEPCAHHGRTPPCADALISAGITRVVVPLTDPDPRVSGRGLAALDAAGITVEFGPCAREAAELLSGYLQRRRSGRPTVTLKLAASLDGRIATAQGESRWITGEQARRRVHLLRARHDCVLVGSGTQLADDPRLDIRLPGLTDRRPVRAVADRRLRTAPAARLLRDGGEVLILGDAAAFPERARAISEAGAPVLPLEGEAGAETMLAALGARGISSVLCEGGAGLAAALLSADAVDRLIWFSAGMALGGDALAAIGALGLERLEAATRFRLDETAPVGADVMSVWHRNRDKGE